MKVFISHSTEEANLASVLKDWIESAFIDQVEVFVSSEDVDILAGEQWFQRVEEALADTNVLLIICSPESVYKAWINFEAGAGWLKGVPVIPICHSGMQKGTLPVPLSFFQALNLEDDAFVEKIMSALAKHFGFSREPRIPYKEMAADIKAAFTDRSYKDGDENMGFIDHLVAMNEGFDRLNVTIRAYGEHTNTASVNTNKFADQWEKANANYSQGTDRHLQKIANKFGDELLSYAMQLTNLNEEYENVLPKTERSLQYVISFGRPVNKEDWAEIETMLIALNGTEESLTCFRNSVRDALHSLDVLPNFQRHLRQAIRTVSQQYDKLIENLNKTLEMIQQTRAVLKSIA